MLKDLIKTQERGGLVIPLLEEQALLAGRRDSLKRRRDVFHPSEIAGDRFCARAWLLGVENPELYLNSGVTANVQWKFDTGHALHALVQERLGDSGKLFGRWQCRRWCNEERCVFFGFKPKPASCPNGTCERASFEYREVSVVDDVLCMRGHTDGILVLVVGKFVFEFKTMRTDAFATLAEPMEAHVEQAVIYLETLKRQDEESVRLLLADGMDEDHEVIRVLRMPYKGAIVTYMNKDSQVFREFLVKTDTPLRFPSGVTVKNMDTGEEKYWLDEKKEMLSGTLAHLAAGTLPARSEVCVSKGCTRARKCFARDACFDKEG